MLLLFTGCEVAKVCLPCWNALQPPPHSRAKPRVPMESLVRVDTGPMPAGLPKLTHLESKLLAAFRPSHDMFLLKPKGRLDRPPDACQAKWVGHVYAFPQSSGNVLGGVYPGNPDDAAAHTSVVFLTAKTKGCDIADMVARSPALQVRPSSVNSF